MCELFGISSAISLHANDLLKTFFSHSDKNPHGWGLAVFNGSSVNLEKEPMPAYSSRYLKARLKRELIVQNMVAHIRKATIGNEDYENCHPFVMRDCEERLWTLIHNGTIFNCPSMDVYVHTQEGKTDSERILCYIIDRINAEHMEVEHTLNVDERFRLLDKIICEISLHNKLNLIIYDGELFYIHTNYRNSLYVCQERDTAYFATVPLDDRLWKPLPFTRLLAYQAGRHIMTGTCHRNEYIDNPLDTKYLFLDYMENQ